MTFFENIPSKSGVYLITCLVNQKLYVGESMNMYNRFHRDYINELKYRNVNRPIIHAFKKYGNNNFKFEILQEYEIGTVTNDELLALETAFIEYFNCLTPNGYNICLYSNNRMGFHCSEKTKKLLSKINKGKYLGNKSGTFGRKHALEEKSKMKITRAMQDMSFKMRAILQIDKNTNEIIKTWECANRAALNITQNPKSASHIHEACKGNINSCYGFKWRYKCSTS